MFKVSASRYFILKDGKPVAADDFTEWANWYEEYDRAVKKTQVGSYEVSTVFLGIDHNWSDEGPPVLFETMVFGDGAYDEQCDRCCTLEEARKQHEAMVRLVAQGGELSH